MHPHHLRWDVFIIIVRGMELGGIKVISLLLILFNVIYKIFGVIYFKIIYLYSKSRQIKVMLSQCICI